MNRTSAHILWLAALLQLVWGIVPSASNIVITQIPVELYISLRWTISGGIFLIALLFTEGWKSACNKTSPVVACLGILGYGVGSLGTLYGLKLGGVVNFALVSSISPLLTSLVSVVFLGETPNKKFLLALTISILGSLLIVVGKHEISSWRIAGLSLGLIVGAYLLEAIVFVFSKKLSHSHSRIAYLATAQVSAAIAMWLAQFFFWHQGSELANLNTTGWAAAAFVSLVACVLCYYVLHWLILHVPGHKLSLFEGLHGISATLFGILLFNETLHPMMIVGGVCVLIGLFMGCKKTKIANVIRLFPTGRDHETTSV